MDYARHILFQNGVSNYLLTSGIYRSMSNSIKKVICYSFSLNNIHDADAMGHLRVVAPYTNIGIEVLPGIVEGQVTTDQIEKAELILIQRNFPQKFKDYCHIISIAHQLKKPVVFDLDDLFFFLPEDHPDRLAHHFTLSLLPMFQAIMEADLVTVASPKLKEILEPIAREVVVVPNYFDDNIWQLKDPYENVHESETVKIGYMGTDSHKSDLVYILPVLLELQQIYQKKIKFCFWGIRPPDTLLINSNVEWTPFFSLDYRRFVEFFQTQHADIFIAPLVDNLFNRCKSPLKFFEYSALGAAGIFSDIEPYKNIIQNGHTGLLASTLGEWKEKLIQLIEDNTLRKKLAFNAQHFIKERWLLSKNKKEIISILQNTKISFPNDNQQLLTNFIQSIHLQINDFIDLKQKDIEKITSENEILRTENNYLQSENENLKREIVSYALSRSWKYTRIFRKAYAKIKRFSGKNQ